MTSIPSPLNKDQTENTCLEAVKQNGFLLFYVDNQTEAICLAAIKQDFRSLFFVKRQTDAIRLASYQ